MKSDHVAILLDRPVVDGKLKYQVLCSCRRRTEIGTRKQVQQEQKQHRREG